MYAAAADILDSPSLRDIWAHYHVTRKDDSPAPNIAEQIRAIENDILEHPDLLVFMHRLIGLEMGALGKPKDNEPAEDSSLRNELDKTYAHIGKLCEDTGISVEKHKLPEESQHLLDIIENHTGKKPFTPFKSLLNMTKNVAVHIGDDARKHPFMFTGFLAMALGIVNMSRQNAGQFSTVFINPQLTAVSGMDSDVLLSENMDNLTFDQNFYNPDLQPTCHDTLVELGGMIAGKPGADFVKEMPEWVVTEFPQHCNKVKTLAQDAQSNIQSTLDFIHQRLDPILRDPATALGDTIGNTSPYFSKFQETFLEAAHSTADFWYAFNDVENITIHTMLTVLTARAVVKLKDWNTPEHKEFRQDATDFLHRNSPLNIPLTYLLTCSGSAYAYAACNGSAPAAIWAGLAGLVAGNVAHKISKSMNAASFARETTLSFQPSTTPLDSTYGHDIVSDTRAEDSIETSHNYHYKGWKDYAKTPAITAGAAVVLTTIDAIATDGWCTATLLGTGIPTVSFWGYNVPEDTLLHGVFIGAGGAIGTILLPITIGVEMAYDKAKDTLAKLFKRKDNNDDNNNEPPSI